MRGLFIAASGLSAHQFQSDLVAHNLANIDTTGFRRHSAVFAEALGGAAGAGVGVQSTVVDDRTGPLVVTGRSLDLAVEGTGFFRLLGPAGDRYTRSGRFALNEEGTVVSPDGLTLAGADGPMRVPQDADSLWVAADGTVLAQRTGRDPRPLGQLLLAVPPAAGTMTPVGNNLWQATAPPALLAPGQDGAGAVVAGSLERGNVDMAEEMAALMRSLRYYQFSARAAQAAGDITSAAVGMWRS